MYTSLNTLLQGGGWCTTIRNCVSRKTTRLGSSKYMDKQVPFTGILSNKAEETPGFSLYLTHACVNYAKNIARRFWRLQDMFIQHCVVIFVDIIFCAQISLTGIESE